MEQPLCEFEGTYPEFVDRLRSHEKQAPYAVVTSSTCNLPRGTIVQLARKGDGDSWHVIVEGKQRDKEVEYERVELQDVNPTSAALSNYTQLLDKHFMDEMHERKNKPITEVDFSYLFSSIEAIICNVGDLGEGSKGAMEEMRTALNGMMPQKERYEYACKRYLTSTPEDKMDEEKQRLREAEGAMADMMIASEETDTTCAPKPGRKEARMGSSPH